MCDRYVFKQGESVAQLPTCYVFPSRYTDNHLKHTDGLIKKMLRGINLTNGPLFLQAFIKKDLPCLYEPGYRTNGAREQYIIGSITGVNSVDMLINYALTGKMAEYNIEEKIDPCLKGKYGCKLSPLIREGTIKRIEGLDVVESLPSVITTVLNNNIGDSIDDSNYGTLKQVAYRSFIVADSKTELEETIKQVLNSITFYDKNNKSMMLPFFDCSIVEKRY